MYDTFNGPEDERSILINRSYKYEMAMRDLNGRGKGE